MSAPSDGHFKRQYESHLKHLRLKGLQPKTIEAYARAIRRIGDYFAYQIEDLSEQQLTDYFTDLLKSHSWSAVKLDLYGLKFFYAHVLHKPWVNVNLIKPPRVQRLPDILTVEEAKRLFGATRTLSYRVFYFTIYSLGLRLGEGLRLQVSDIDAARGGCLSVMRRVTRTASFPYQRRHWRCSAAFGRDIATRCCSSPTATVA